MDLAKMTLVDLGRTGLRVSPLGLGTVKFGRNQGVKYPSGFELPDEDTLADLLDLTRSLGINLLDTAPAYGASEERLGRLLAGQRDDWVLIGKVGEEFEGGVSSHHFTPDHFRRSLERSLQRLRTDRIDILLIHSDGSDMAILQDDALMRTMADFRAEGTARAIGVSTKTVEGGLRTLDLMDVVMATYTAGYRDEEPVLDRAAALGKGAILKKVLSSGHAADVPAALRFAFSHPGVASAVIGTINPAHLRQIAACIDAATAERRAG